VKRKEVCIVVILAATDAALQAERSESRLECAKVQRAHVAGYFRNPVAEIVWSARHDCMRILISAIEREPALWGNFEIKAETAALDLAEILALEQER